MLQHIAGPASFSKQLIKPTALCVRHIKNSKTVSMAAGNVVPLGLEYPLTCMPSALDGGGCPVEQQLVRNVLLLAATV
jgi:hypothetical protein